MATKKSGLGRGLGELLSMVAVAEAPVDESKSPVSTAKPKNADIAVVAQTRYLPIDLLQPGEYQPRKIMRKEHLEELAESIRAHGVLQPILLRKLNEEQYEIVAGERRWRAAQLAGLDRVPVFVKEISDEAAMAMGLIENIQRQDLNPVEQAQGLKRLGEEFKMTHDEIAQAVGKSRASITNLLRLLNLEPAVSSLLQEGQLDMGHARALLSLTHRDQVKVAHIVVAKKLSVRATEALVKKMLSPAAAKRASAPVSGDTIKLQQQISDKLGAKVNIQHTSKGDGKLVIQYHNLDELEGILGHIL
jgi:ParB family chromosome partitioning protein